MGQASSKLRDRAESNDFAKLLEESMKEKATQGAVVNGRVIAVNDDNVVVDVGLKSEGRIALREFSMPGQPPEIKVGDIVEVFVERLEDRNGETVLSREKARREEVWFELEKLHKKAERVTGVIFSKVKGGFTVDLGGALAFLPGSQVDIRPIKDANPIMGTPQPFIILKMDRQRGNIVVSRRAVLEESREANRSEIMGQISEGQVLKGTVKNITDYGAFVDLGGVDGLLHITDISWKRVNHPSEVLSVGATIEVQVIKYNQENQRISLGMKQLENDPWAGVAEKFSSGQKLRGKITNMADYGAFVELGDGVEGLVHVSEMSWTKKNIHPSKLVTQGQEVDVVVLEVDNEKRRISLGMKQAQDNPWAKFADTHNAGDTIEGEIRNVTEFGLFIALGPDIDGMAHMSDLSWEKSGEAAIKEYNKGDTVKVKILDMDPEKERVSLGVKQLTNDPFDGAMKGVDKGAVVTCTVTEVHDKGIEVTVNDYLKGSIKKPDLSKERSEQRSDRFAVGEKVDAKVLTVDLKKRIISLSIKAKEIDEDKAALEAFGSTESGASLGDILGAALKKDGGTDEPKKKPAKKAKDEAAE